MATVVGLTGGIGTGKSTVSTLLREKYHVPVVDADAIAREVVVPGSVAHFLLRRVAFRAYPEVFPAGRLDRGALGRLVFAPGNEKLKRRLNATTHPFILSRMISTLVWNILGRRQKIVVLDTPLLFETRSLLPMCSRTIVVKCGSEEQQLARIAERSANGDGPRLGPGEARQRIKAQLPIEQKCAMANHVLDNSGTRDELDSQLPALLEALEPNRTVRSIFVATHTVVSMSLCLVVLRPLVRIVRQTLRAE